MRRTQLLNGGFMCLALATAAGAQTAIAPVPVAEPVLTESAARAPRSFPVADDKHEHAASLIEAAEHAAAVFDAVLVNAAVTTPPGLRVLVTEYTFEVFENVKGSTPSLVTIRESGGVNPDGSGVCTVDSHKLVVGGRYLVFVEPGQDQLLFPFARILQVLDSGATIADEEGRLFIGLQNGVPVVRDHAEAPTMNYLGRAPSAPLDTEIGPPDISSTPVPLQVAEPALVDHGPIPAEQVIGLLRAPGVPAPTAPQPAGLASGGPGGIDYTYCGYAAAAHNFACWLPDAGPWSWFNTAEIDWDNLVTYTNSGGWILGLRTSGGTPIRNEAPVANNNRDNAGTPSDAQMIAGGYGSWAANGSPNGITFRWFSGGGCVAIDEVDAFVNPVNITDELQFRKSMVHELGHGLGFNHEDRTVAIMVSGTWRVPPNYSSNYYNRADECIGGRAMLAAANGVGASWDIRDWRDISTVSQAHPNWGSSGDVGPNVTALSTYSASTGDPVQIQHMYVDNRGNLDFADGVHITIYLSTNTTISAADYVVWDGGWSSFGAGAHWNNGSLNLNIGPGIPTGNYYIGWILTPDSESELTSNNNTGIMVRTSTYSFSERTIHITNLVPPNNDCADATPILDGTTPFSTEWATTDGPAEPGCSFCCADDQIHKDIWFRYTATCTGTVRVDTCGSLYDTKLGVYTSCPAGSGSVLACNDDSCGLQSRVSFAAISGHSYLIRVGGYNGASGTGDITISCTGCYANCDNSTTPPILNVQDFSCFLNRYSANDPWANCDGSTTAPVLNVNDFTCFLNRFAAGCS
jgi:hypothetical protein